LCIFVKFALFNYSLTSILKKFNIYRVSAVTPELRIANPNFNAEVICNVLNKNKSDLFVFPELSISGYSCMDLFFQNTLLENCYKAVDKIVKESRKIKSLIVIGSPVHSANKLFNAALVIAGGKILGAVPKTYLCNSNEYYEERWFTSSFDTDIKEIEINSEIVPFGNDLIFSDKNNPMMKFALEICEDLWAPIPPSNYAAVNGALIIANLSASNEYLGKSEYRNDTVKMQSGRLISAYVYAASGVWESTSDTIFSGASMIYENSVLMSSCKSFSFNTEICSADIDIEKLYNDRMKNNTFAGSKTDKSFRNILFDIKFENYTDILRKISQTPFIPDNESQITSVCSKIIEIQSSALIRRMKHINIKDVVLGISGGLDSTLALLTVYNSFKKSDINMSGIHAVSMPGFGTGKRTKSNAEELANLLGVNFKEIPIINSVSVHFDDIGHDKSKTDIVYENAQARRRTHILMDIANSVKGIVIGTGDLSESALGWCTYGGDHLSMYGVNAGIPKTLVKYVIGWYAEYVFNGRISEILDDIINTPVSPELLPPDESGDISQITEELVGPYVLNDFFLYHFIRHSFSAEKIVFLAETAFKGVYDRTYIANAYNDYIKRFFVNQFKRNSVPDSIKVGTVSLSQRAEWRMASDCDYSSWLINIK